MCLRYLIPLFSPPFAVAYDVSISPSSKQHTVISVTVWTPVFSSRSTLKTRTLSLPYRADARDGIVTMVYVGGGCSRYDGRSNGEEEEKVGRFWCSSDPGNGLESRNTGAKKRRSKMAVDYKCVFLETKPFTAHGYWTKMGMTLGTSWGLITLRGGSQPHL